MDRAVYGTQQIVSDGVAKFVPPNINLFIVYEEPITAWQCAGFAEQKMTVFRIHPVPACLIFFLFCVLSCGNICL